jgi:Cu-Zn family superoxide dismutase
MKIARLGFSLLSICLLAGCASTSKKTFGIPPKDMGYEIFAHARLYGKSGAHVEGEAWFAQDKTGVRIVAEVSHATPGLHGIHIHENGDCSAEDASSAGEHFNPTHLTHGASNPFKHHIGDLGNIKIDSKGNGTLNLFIPTTRLSPDFLDYKKLIGKSVILHAKQDDLKNQPSGNSGARIACGTIVSYRHATR